MSVSRRVRRLEKPYTRGHDQINDIYFFWLCSFVYVDGIEDYDDLLIKLHNTHFIPLMPMDKNRNTDGCNLRYRFGEEEHFDKESIDVSLGGDKCSMLELMVALSVRCEDSIMSNPKYGDRTSVWFWEMVKSLGLSGMKNSKFDERHIENTVSIFNDRKYSPDGSGGLYTVSQADSDLRKIELWYQMHLYLNNIED